MSRPVVIVAVLLMLAASARAGEPECAAAVADCHFGAVKMNPALADINMVLFADQPSAGDAQYLCGNATRVQACFVGLTAAGGACKDFTSTQQYVVATTGAPAGSYNYLTIGAPTCCPLVL